MSVSYRIASAVTTHARIVLVVFVVATAAVGAGLPMIEDDTSLDQFTGDSDAARADEYVDANFTAPGEENTTQALVVRTGENVLTRESLLNSLRLQRAIRANDSINETLIEDDPITGLENVIAITAIREDRADTLQDWVDENESRRDALNETEDRLLAGLNHTQALTRAFVNDTAGLQENSSAYRQREDELNRSIEAVVATVTADLGTVGVGGYDNAAFEVKKSALRLAELRRQNGENATEREEARENIQRQYDIASDLLGFKRQQLFYDFRAIREEFEDLRNADRPSLEAQIDALEAENDSEYDRIVRHTLNGSGSDGDEILELVASSYEINTTTAEARITVLTQRTDGSGGLEMGVTDPDVIESQLHLRELVDEYGASAGTRIAAADTGGDGTGADSPEADGVNASGGEYLVFGSGLTEREIDASMGDSLAIVGPFALLFVVLALAIAYRDLLDIVLGLVGIATVLVWTFGLLGWSGLSFNVLFVAVPILLIGLSIDFAIHVFMRHRERRGEDDDSVRGSMAVALSGVGVALAWVTATTAMGFLANVVSPLGVIREFGIVGAFGIVSALFVFGAFVPAAKVELDSLLESYGLDRRKRAIGTGGGRLGGALSVGAVAARRAPILVLVVVLLATAGGAYGATQVETTFDQEDFVAQSPPEWTYSLPGGMAPGEYRTADVLDVVDANFQREDTTAEILVRGNVTDDRFLRRIATARRAASEREAVFTLPNGEADVEGPLSAMRDTAADNATFNVSFNVADTTNDDIPNRVPDDDLGELYDDFFDADADAASEVIYRTNGTNGSTEYRAVRLIVGVRGDATYAETTEDVRAVADVIEGDGTVAEVDGVETPDRTAGAWTAIATGTPVVNHVIETFLFDTLTESFLAALVAIVLFLTLAYRLTGGSATLGAVTLLPVVLSIAWILGTMHLLGMPFNVLTVMITSLGIGLGVDYAIHVSSRYRLELDRRDNAWEAIETTVRGTGGALLGSAATTIGAFGTLALAILPVIRQFGIIAAVSIAYAFLASVVVLPTFLLLWTRYLGPEASFEAPGRVAGTGSATTDAGGDGSARTED